MKLAYYPGCSAEGSGIEYALSTERTAHLLGIELVEIPDWNCCGATSGHNTDRLLSLALPARNLALAEQMGLDMLTPCAACYSRHRAAEVAVKEDPLIKEKVQQIIDREIEGKTRTVSILDILANSIGVEDIRQKVTNPLTTMKAACYYGCLLVRPVEHTGFDDPEDPQSMDNIMKALGAQPIEWSHKTECCGAALVTSRPDIGHTVLSKILKDAKQSGAECIVTACPLCMLNLDMRQSGVEKSTNEEFNIPIYYITELLAIACGDSPEQVGIEKHFVEAGKYLETVKMRAKEAALLKEKEVKQKTETKKKTASGADKPQNKEAVQKKIEGMKKALVKNPEKIVGKLLDDENKIKVLIETLNGNEKKIEKIAELMVTDHEKAVKAAEALINAELKKREKS